jgi:hypothetical protein
MIVYEAVMLLLSGVIQRRLAAAGIAAAMALAPLTAHATGSPDVDALWNQHDGSSVDSAFYVVQTWWDGLTRATQSDPTQRGLDELAQANTDLLNAYGLLQQQRSNPGPQPLAVIDPLLSGVYNAVTGSNVKAPIGSVFNWANQSLLKLEGRGSTDDIVRSLMQDYRDKQAAAMRHLPSGRADTAALVAANAQRETAFLVKIKAISTPSDGLATLLDAADQSTIAVAAKHSTSSANAPAKANGTNNNGGKGTNNNSGPNASGNSTAGNQSGPKN